MDDSITPMLDSSERRANLGSLEEMCGLWVGPRLSSFERLCIRSFLDHGHQFQVVHLFERGRGFPPEQLSEDGREVLAETTLKAFLAQGAPLAAFSDWFRWELLRTRGGWWVDMDMVCLRPFRFESSIVFGLQDPQTAEPWGASIPGRALCPGADDGAVCLSSALSKG